MKPNNTSQFTGIDYLTSGVMITFCLGIGCYFGIFKTSSGAHDYLIGNRNMKLFPISMSLIASCVSGISMLSNPTTAYLYGELTLYRLPGWFLMTLIATNVYLPVLYELKITSVYEYFAKRFDDRVRLLASLFYTIHLLTFLPVVTYVAALAVNHATGVNIHLVSPAINFICIIYTCLGGIKAVVWTDVVQALVMFGSLIIIVIKGTIDAGGLISVIKKGAEGERFHLSVNAGEFLSLTGGTQKPLKQSKLKQGCVGKINIICSDTCLASKADIFKEDCLL